MKSERKFMFLWNKKLKPFRDYIKTKLQKSGRGYGVGHVIVGDWKQKRREIEKYFARPSVRETVGNK
jgi:hypothetical protein